MDNINKTCGNCAYHNAGLCHRNPPAYTGHEHNGLQMLVPRFQQPLVFEHDWCGEHQLAERA